MTRRSSIAALGLVVLLGLSFFVGGSARQSVPGPQASALLANLYMQTAAEYRALCLQIYALAGEGLARLVESQPKDQKPLAIVMDLDETVFDNGGYESFLDKYEKQNSDDLWKKWETFPEEVRLVPGAKEFIAAAEKLVTVVYVSNRFEENRAKTQEALKHLGLATQDLDAKRLKLKSTRSSDKTARRQEAENDFRVLLYFGDNLRDFSEEFLVPPDLDEQGQRRAIDGRFAKVDARAAKWGHDWIVLPNPVYGEWQKPLGKDARSKLRDTAMKP